MGITSETNYLLGCFAIFLITALFFEQRQKHALSLLLLTIGGFFVYLTAAKLCAFINIWDEQYHALVAKNCMEHPFKPMLYDEAIVLGHDYSNWIFAHVWLHKQPLFLWQIALSFKIFGISELSLRLPSVIQCTLMIPLCYRMALLLTQRRDTAFFTALVAACSWFLFQLTSGIQSTDHNDVCFVFYITTSVWAFLEYTHRDRKKRCWVILIGLFAGCAILTKWVVGFFVYLVWGIYLLSEYRLEIRKWKIGDILFAVVVTLLIAAPWQIYILQAYPEVAQHELFYNFKHFNNSVEDHNGSVWYYLIVLPVQYFGAGNPYQTNHFIWNAHTIICYSVLLLGFVLMIRQLRQPSHRITLIFSILFVFIFFTTAKTKMPAFTFVLCFAGFLSIACLLSVIANGILRIQWKPLARFLLTLGCLLFSVYNINYPFFYKGTSKYNMKVFLNDKVAFERWAREVPSDYYIFNVKSPEFSEWDYTSCIAATFYSNHACYFEAPTQEIIDTLRTHGKRVAVARNPWLNPEFERDSTILKLDMR